MTCFVIVKKTERGLFSICRRYIGAYKAADYWFPVRRQYGGRLSAGSSLTFDTMEEIQRFIENNRNFLFEVDGPVFVGLYDPCLNHIYKKIMEVIEK